MPTAGADIVIVMEVPATVTFELVPSAVDNDRIAALMRSNAINVPRSSPPTIIPIGSDGDANIAA